jgi:hypothetical protein
MVKIDRGPGMACHRMEDYSGSDESDEESDEEEESDDEDPYSPPC